jgi:rubrerythrin
MTKKTQANLKEAFAGESQAHTKYLIFADRADRDGFPEVARLFRAIAYAEYVHALNHLRALGGLGDTVANLGTAIGGENYENVEMYPAFDVVAREEEAKSAIRTFRYALEAEKIHEVMYGDAKERVAAGEDIPAAPVYVCPTCGHTAIGEAPDECPVCGVRKDKFHEF